ncbi:NADH-ubiquinone oxidoreductase complex I, 21 kDa subunit-domain-containing protein [Obelidium mucronatum]|nr:NADH-ubiquinone oxidoreductase complex I, 21 kDa subunit-domain-containing protein [Obelidium mucronatum]
MKFVSNLPDQEHVPYKFIAAEPHFKKVVGYFRTSDYATMGAIGAGFPAAHLLWERSSPSFHPKHLPRLMMIQVPFFLSVGFLFACQRSYFRFWGWSENAIEAARWESEADSRPTAASDKPKRWTEGQDW